MSEEKQLYTNPLILARARELRRPQTPAEAKLWARLHNRQLGFKFRRQQPIDRFIVDFCCFTSRLIIEVDGDSHVEQADYDAARTEWLEQRGWRVMRFSNAEVHGQIEAVLEAILTECGRGV